MIEFWIEIFFISFEIFKDLLEISNETKNISIQNSIIHYTYGLLQKMGIALRWTTKKSVFVQSR